MLKDTDAFHGGVAVITGAGSGIGAALARRAAALNMLVIAVDIDMSGAQATVDQIVEAGGKAEAVEVDVSRADQVEALAAGIFARHGAVRLLINNAGIETVGYSWEIPANRWDATLAVNLGGVINCTRAFVPRLLKQGQEAWIGNVSSVAALGHMPAQTAYVMTKHAVQAFSECLYLELELKGAAIHVSSIVPGPVNTAIFDPSNNAGEPVSAQAHRAAMATMLREFGMTPDEAASMFLDQMAAKRFWVTSHSDLVSGMAQDRATFLTGQRAPSMPDIAHAIAVEA